MTPNDEPTFPRYGNACIMAHEGVHEAVAGKIRSILELGSRILDFGCGQGAMTQRLVDMGYDVVGVDVDPGSYETRAPFVHLDFNDPTACEEFACRNHGAFDMVIGVEVIEHLENPWQYVRNMKRLVRPGGYLVISTPNVSSWYSRLDFFFKGRLHHFEDADLSYGHINPMLESEIRLICERNALKVQEVFPAGELPRLWNSRSARRALANLVGCVSSYLMSGNSEGWCIVVVARRT